MYCTDPDHSCAVRASDPRANCFAYQPNSLPNNIANCVAYQSNGISNFPNCVANFTNCFADQSDGSVFLR